jgi:hypothetical protein
MAIGCLKMVPRIQSEEVKNLCVDIEDLILE